MACRAWPALAPAPQKKKTKKALALAPPKKGKPKKLRLWLPQEDKTKKARLWLQQKIKAWTTVHCALHCCTAVQWCGIA